MSSWLVADATGNSKIKQDTADTIYCTVVLYCTCTVLYSTVLHMCSVRAGTAPVLCRSAYCGCSVGQALSPIVPDIYLSDRPGVAPRPREHVHLIPSHLDSASIGSDDCTVLPCLVGRRQREHDTYIRLGWGGPPGESKDCDITESRCKEIEWTQLPPPGQHWMGTPTEAIATVLYRDHGFRKPGTTLSTAH